MICIDELVEMMPDMDMEELEQVYDDLMNGREYE